MDHARCFGAASSAASLAHPQRSNSLVFSTSRAKASRYCLQTLPAPFSDPHRAPSPCSKVPAGRAFIANRAFSPPSSPSHRQGTKVMSLFSMPLSCSVSLRGAIVHRGDFFIAATEVKGRREAVVRAIHDAVGLRWGVSGKRSTRRCSARIGGEVSGSCTPHRKTIKREKLQPGSC